MLPPWLSNGSTPSSRKLGWVGKVEQQRKVLGISDGGGEQLLIILDTARKTVPGTFCPGFKVATASVPGLRPGCITITCPCQESKN